MKDFFVMNMQFIDFLCTTAKPKKLKSIHSIFPFIVE